MRRLMVAVLAASMVLGVIGCSDDDDKTTAPDTSGPTYLARTSPENVLTNLVVAYEGRDIAGYRDQMDSSFVFIPSTNDPDVNFDELPFAADQESTENMFDVVDHIDLTLVHPAPIPSDRPEYPEEDGYRLIQVTSVQLRVVTREMIDGEPLVLTVGGDPAVFIFEPDSTQTPPTYRIVYQQDPS
jgi:hypothetical protein